jgi:hypothetical protein
VQHKAHARFCKYRGPQALGSAKAFAKSFWHQQQQSVLSLYTRVVVGSSLQTFEHWCCDRCLFGLLTVYVCSSLLPKPHSPSLQPLPSAIVQISTNDVVHPHIQSVHNAITCLATLHSRTLAQIMLCNTMLDSWCIHVDATSTALLLVLRMLDASTCKAHSEHVSCIKRMSFTFIDLSAIKLITPH